MNYTMEFWMEAIIRGGAEDLPRLEFADWLQERDGPGDEARAEFIRVQCRVVEIEKVRGDPIRETANWRHKSGGVVAFKPIVNDLLAEYKAVRGRERALLSVEAFDLWKTFCPWGRTSWTMTVHAHEPKFRIGPSEGHSDDIWFHLGRGFPDSLTLSAEGFLAHHEALYWHPEQTAACDAGCRKRWTGGYAIDNPDGMGWKLCGKCDGTGHAPRPFIPTALPLADVHLTTAIQPSEAFRFVRDSPRERTLEFVVAGQAVVVSDRAMHNRGPWVGIQGAVDEFYKLAWEARWPGLTFHPPQTLEAPAETERDRELRQYQRRQLVLRESIRQEWIPARGSEEWVPERRANLRRMLYRHVHDVAALPVPSDRRTRVTREGFVTDLELVRREFGTADPERGGERFHSYVGHCPACRRAYLTEPVVDQTFETMRAEAVPRSSRRRR